METDVTNLERVGSAGEPGAKQKSLQAFLATRNESGRTNKNLVFGAIVGVVVLLSALSVVLPLLRREKRVEESAGATPSASVLITDYEALVPPRSSAAPQAQETVAEEAEELPPPPEPVFQVVPEPPTRIPPVTTPSGTTSSAAYASDRPFTRDDRLQSKSISGVKGLTPTQKRYADGSGADAPSATVVTQDNPYAQFGLPNKDEYAQRLLASSGQTAGAQAPAYPYGGGNAYTAQNDQSGKMQFYQSGRENAGQGQWLPQAAVWQGTIFDAVLLSDVNTDLPGECVAVISKNIYSSLDGKYMLIPQNSRLFGVYNSSIGYSQSRVQVGWHTLIRPDGYAVNLGNMQATDARGAAGLPGAVNDHPFQYLKALALISAFRIVGTELGASAAAYQDNQYVQNLVADTQNVVNQFGAKIIDRALDVQPTIVIKAGTKINVVTNTPLLLPPLDPYPVAQPYHR
jgi:type IV secretion system protein VirB10